MTPVAVAPPPASAAAPSGPRASPAAARRAADPPCRPVASGARERLRALRSRLTEAGEAYWAERSGMQLLAASGWTACAEGRREPRLDTPVTTASYPIPAFGAHGRPVCLRPQPARPL